MPRFVGAVGVLAAMLAPTGCMVVPGPPVPGRAEDACARLGGPQFGRDYGDCLRRESQPTTRLVLAPAVAPQAQQDTQAQRDTSLLLLGAGLGMLGAAGNSAPQPMQCIRTLLGMQCW
jgi:hypothetical protein